MSARAILLLALFIPSVPVCFFQPFYGIALWTIVAFLNPQSFLWAAGAYIFPWAQAVAIPTVLGFLIFAFNWPRLATRETFLLGLLWIWFTITSIVSSHTPEFTHHEADTWTRWSYVSKVLLMTIVTIGVVNSRERLRKLLLVIAACFGILVLKGIPFMITSGAQHRLHGPDHSMTADNNDYGLALNMTLPLFFFLAQTEQRQWVRRLFAVVFFATIPTIFFTYSRGALLSLVILLTLMFLQLKQRWLLAPVFVLAGMIAIVAAPDSWKERMDPGKEDAIDASAQSRLNAWTFCWNLAKDYPLTGGGFATFTQPLFDRYAPNPTDVHGPHSVYFGILAEHGFVGLALYLSVVASTMATAWNTGRLARRDGDDVAVAYSNMFRFALIGFLTSGTFLGRAYFDYYFTIVACAAILKQVRRFERDSDPVAEQRSEEVPA